MTLVRGCCVKMQCLEPSEQMPQRFTALSSSSFGCQDLLSLQPRVPQPVGWKVITVLLLNHVLKAISPLCNVSFMTHSLSRQPHRASQMKQIAVILNHPALDGCNCTHNYCYNLLLHYSNSPIFPEQHELAIIIELPRSSTSAPSVSCQHMQLKPLSRS